MSGWPLGPFDPVSLLHEPSLAAQASPRPYWRPPKIMLKLTHLAARERVDEDGLVPQSEG
jgi:hypothetical protein